ncbi:latrophilin-like protein LAT-2 [Asterias amurensis]|uniref:latrophilin-like protein LAT-2 n=1 Tax=Asterias amurensis TaxID=7602 RepID=UPI003AB433D2
MLQINTKLKRSEIGSKIFQESIDNASLSLARMSAHLDNIEAAFLPLRNDGETHSLTSDSSKVTLTSAIVSVSTKALNGVKGAALSVVSTLDEVAHQLSSGLSNGSFLGTAIVSVSLESKDGDAGSLDLKGHPIQVELIHRHNQTKQTGKLKRTCVYYDDVTEQWSSEGCTMTSEGDASTICSFNHLTNFAVLMQIDPDSNACDFKALDVLSAVGSVITIVCLALTLCAFTLLKMFKAERNVVHGNLAFAVLVSQLVFFIGIDAAENRTACSAVAVLLHYFLLSSFSWMLIEGALLFVKAVFIFHRELHPFKVMALGWGMPIPIVAITFAAVQSDGYGYSSDFPGCWLNGIAIWAFICPITVVITVNTVFVIAVIRSYLRLKATKDKTELAKIRGVLRAIMIIQPLMGFTWLLGFGVSGQVVACVLFVILNTLQGVFIFVLYCLRTEEVQTVLKKFKNKISPQRGEDQQNQLRMSTMSASSSTKNTSLDSKTSSVPFGEKAGWT